MKSDQYNAETMDLKALLGEESVAYQQLMTISLGLKRKQIAGSAATKATVEILRIILGSGKYYNADELMRASRAVGKELSSSAPWEVTISNVVRRVLFLIREEFAHKLWDGEHGTEESAAEDVSRRTRRDSYGDLEERLPVPPALSVPSALNLSRAESDGSLASSSPRSRNDESIMDSSRQRSLGNVLGAFSAQTLLEENFKIPMPTLRQSIMGGINELNDEIDNVLGPICEQSMEQIHADQCILTFGWSGVVESFLKSAARKRKFQVIIAEGGPDLPGHKLAQALSDAPNAACTLIPDCAIYAIMSRVNTVLVAPHALMADGGAICTAGHLAVATVAKEHHVPVVGLASTFIITPQFAHSSNESLGLLLSPSLVVQYNTNICQENVEVVNPAYDFLPPALMDLYVTNNGSHQPSYVYRLLSEFYSPKDHSM